MIPESELKLWVALCQRAQQDGGPSYIGMPPRELREILERLLKAEREQQRQEN